MASRPKTCSVGGCLLGRLFNCHPSAVALWCRRPACIFRCRRDACTTAIEITASPAEAWDAVHRLAEPDDLVCITGSFFLAAEIRRQIAARPLCVDRASAGADRP